MTYITKTITKSKKIFVKILEMINFYFRFMQQIFKNHKMKILKLIKNQTKIIKQTLKMKTRFFKLSIII